MINIPRHEQGVTRVFALSLSDTDATRLRDSISRQSAALGVDALAPAGVEVFRIADLGELGLVGYLREGIDAEESDLKRDSVKLAALDGWVMLLHSTAFQGKETALSLAPEVTLVGSYAQVRPDTTPIPLEAEAAKPYSGPPAADKPAHPLTKPRGSLVSVLLLIFVAVVLWWVLA